MQGRPIAGSTDWTTHQIVLDVPENSSLIAFGQLLDGPGRVWFTNFEFEVVSMNVATTGRLDFADLPDAPTNLSFKD
jgi:hypothetical protein